jgi:hypothetical protein
LPACSICFEQLNLDKPEFAGLTEEARSFISALLVKDPMQVGGWEGGKEGSPAGPAPRMLLKLLPHLHALPCLNNISIILPRTLQRPSAEEALRHPFLRGSKAERAAGKPLDKTVVQRIQASWGQPEGQGRGSHKGSQVGL